MSTRFLRTSLGPRGSDLSLEELEAEEDSDLFSVFELLLLEALFLLDSFLDGVDLSEIGDFGFFPRRLEFDRLVLAELRRCWDLLRLRPASP